MKGKKELRESLGITQQETALLIDAKLSSLAMYEIGERELTTYQLLELAKMQNFVLKNESKKEKNKLVLQERKRAKAILQKELNGFELEKLLTERKLQEANQKYQKALSALVLLEYLENNETHKKSKQQVLAKIKMSAEIALEKYGPIQLSRLNLTLQTLNFQIEVYQKEINLL
ncbi:helix-turn-helix transcriptional regulator [Flavobacterium sp.]|uniref:helix-turn-helix transcriptional regulator n=1 Tax=Flavobacterium sp. TaxID=239 RepID=UPI0028BE07D2|nr:helix-turn-helix transcriptional regulator [Flavobacterium sp.]